ncbi:MAG: hypothetical protein JXR82_01315 [Marinifilaceae bacterium]|nr:hypothetical protein [Marinifilaceae bacterium]
MGLYEGIKDVAKVIQQADNVELYKQLIELSAQALDLQNEITHLTSENIALKKSKDIEERIERHSEPFITLHGDSDSILFCSHCWDYERKLIQVSCNESGSFKCVHCENNGIYNKGKYDEYTRREKEGWSRLNQKRSREW